MFTFLRNRCSSSPEYATVPPEELKQERDQLFNLSDLRYVDLIDWSNYDARKATLQIDLDSVKVHVVNSVSFEASEHSVVRTRIKNDNPEF